MVRDIYYILLHAITCTGIDDATPKAILTGHQSEILNVIVSAELGIVVSSSIGKYRYYYRY